MKTMIFRSTSRDNGAPGHRDRSGSIVEVVRPLDASEHDNEEVGDMFRIRFNDGTEADAFADELTAATMTPERARYILSRVSYGDLRMAFSRYGGATHPDGITVEEDAHVREVWSRLPGWTSYHSAVCAIAYPEKWQSVEAG
jgi:hypothetical protein